MIKRVMLAGGGTGGHLYPGLAVAEKLRQRGVECSFVGTRRGIEARVVPEQGFPIHLIQARGLAGKPWQKLWALALLGWGTLQSLRLLGRHRPQLILSTGGYVCAPLLLAAAVRRLPVVMLEQNALPGKVNRKLGGLARRICLSFEESRRFFPADRCVVTGNPVRGEILDADRESARRHFALGDRPCLLITGASQGAASLNAAVLRALPLWADRPWTVLHLTGPKHLDAVRSAAASLLPEGSALDYRSFGYMGDMHLALAAADLVVSRAGATTLAELTARGLPSILVPYPFAAEKHQDHNADTLVSRGAAVKLDDSGVEQGLADVAAGLMEDSQQRGIMARASSASGLPHALESIVALIEREFGAPPMEAASLKREERT